MTFRRQTLQFAGSHLLTSLLSFNVGVELGQVFVLLLLVPTLNLLFRLGFPERTGTIILSALVADTGWHWMLKRGDRLRSSWPPPG
jgi:HupE/UreJ protein